MTNVLFLCDHAAGKSLLGATYFRAAAARAGLDVSIDLAGPDPDDHPMTNVAAALEAQGHVVSWQPRRVGPADFDDADLIVNVGCSLDDLPPVGATELVTWDVPMLSADFDASIRAIHARAESLATELAAR